MSLIDHKYTNFINGELRIKTINPTEKAEMLVRLDDACIDAENIILKKLLGEVEFLNFQNDHTSEFNLTFINGYKVDGKYQPYNTDLVYYGLKDMISYFAFYYFLKSLNEDKTIGEIQPNWPAPKMVGVYNSGVNKFYQALDFIDYSKGLDSTLLPYQSVEYIDKLNTFGI